MLAMSDACRDTEELRSKGSMNLKQHPCNQII